MLDYEEVKKVRELDWENHHHYLLKNKYIRLRKNTGIRARDIAHTRYYPEYSGRRRGGLYEVKGENEAR